MAKAPANADDERKPGYNIAPARTARSSSPAKPNAPTTPTAATAELATAGWGAKPVRQLRNLATG